MAISDRINEMYTHVGEVYDTITNVDLPTNKNIENIPSTIRKSYLDIMNNGIDTIYDNWEKVNGTGTSISLNNTEEAPMTIEYKGNTSQGENPTPTTPQDIHVVSGNNSINVCGKNLFDGEMELGGFNSDGINNNVNNRIRSKNYTKVQPNTQYTISFNNNTQTNMQVSISYYDANDYITPRLSFLGWTGGTSITFTTPNNCEYMRFLISYVGDATIIPDAVSNIQLEKSNQATTYEEYKGASYEINLGDKELCKIGTYQDKIFKNTPNSTYYDSNLEDNVWYLNKQIGKVVLDGTNYNGKGTTGTNAYYLTTNIIALNNNSLAVAYSDMFKPCSFNDRVNGLDIIYSQNGGLNLRTANNTSIDWSSEENCKSWLNSNTPLVYYILNTPTYEKITGELLNQLEAIKKSYENQTNINQENNDLPFELEVVALEKY